MQHTKPRLTSLILSIVMVLGVFSFFPNLKTAAETEIIIDTPEYVTVLEGGMSIKNDVARQGYALSLDNIWSNNIAENIAEIPLESLGVTATDTINKVDIKMTNSEGARSPRFNGIVAFKANANYTGNGSADGLVAHPQFNEDYPNPFTISWELTAKEAAGIDNAGFLQVSLYWTQLDDATMGIMNVDLVVNGEYVQVPVVKEPSQPVVTEPIEPKPSYPGTSSPEPAKSIDVKLRGYDNEAFSYEYEYTWNDNNIFKYNYKYDHKLATASAYLMASVDEFKSNKNYKYNLEKLGFSNIKTYEDYKHNGTTCPRFVLAEKETVINRQNAKLVAIFIYGTEDGEDFANDAYLINEGDVLPGYHPGFRKVELAVYSALMEYLDDDTTDCYFYLSGHSLGAAAANILAKELTELHSEDNVTAYTFATPNVYNIPKKIYSNIHNVVNDKDIVPSILPMSWKFGKTYAYRQYNFWDKTQESPALKKSYQMHPEGTWAIEKSQLIGGNSLAILSAPFVSNHIMRRYISLLQLGKPTAVEYAPGMYYKISCPTDVTVKYGEEVIFQTENNEIITDTYGIGEIVNGEEKKIYLPHNYYMFDIEISAFEDGEMSYSVGQIDPETGEEIETVCAENIPIKAEDSLNVTSEGSLYQTINEEEIPIYIAPELIPEFTYTVLENDTAVITGYTGAVTELEIPAKIDGYTVVDIADGAFENNVDLTFVTFPKSVTEISQDSFYDYQLLTISGYFGTSAETFASANNLPFVGIEEPIKLTSTLKKVYPTSAKIYVERTEGNAKGAISYVLLKGDYSDVDFSTMKLADMKNHKNFMKLEYSNWTKNFNFNITHLDPNTTYTLVPFTVKMKYGYFGLGENATFTTPDISLKTVVKSVTVDTAKFKISRTGSANGALGYVLLKGDVSDLNYKTLEEYKNSENFLANQTSKWTGSVTVTVKNIESGETYTIVPYTQKGNVYSFGLGENTVFTAE